MLADNPRLNVRVFPTLRQPARIVLDSKLQTPLGSHMVSDDLSPTVIVTAVDDEERLKPYRAFSHIRILRSSENVAGRIDLAALLPQLAELGYGEIMVEAGATLTSAFIESGLADEIVLYQAPKILGEGRSLLTLPANPAVLTSEGEWESRSVELIGQDVKWVLRKK